VALLEFDDKLAQKMTERRTDFPVNSGGTAKERNT
jgi:hypothetical protein